ncbi:hypothetical protein, partial [Streptococcus pneumoniae]|uniref:hypothetical protein n=1 Tax=Streptococcus pneumoniae TaxID=1313 RepID=UPI001CDD0042
FDFHSVSPQSSQGGLIFLATNRINKLVQLATFLIDEIDIHEGSRPLFFAKDTSMNLFGDLNL